MRKKAGRNSSGLPSELNLQRLERQLQSQLHRAAAARPDDRVSCRHIRRRASATEGTCRRIIHSITILSAVGISEIRMVENVEKLRPELRVNSFAQVPVLGHGEIEILESRVGEHVARHISEMSQLWRDHDGIALRIAAKVSKSFSSG